MARIRKGIAGWVVTRDWKMNELITTKAKTGIHDELRS